MYNGPLGDAGVVFWGISEEQPHDLNDFAVAFDIDMPILADPDRTAQSKYQGKVAFPTAAYPQTYVVDAEGKLVYFNNVHDTEELELVLEDLIATD